MKARSRIYKGIEYVELTDLPLDQQEKIKEIFDEDFLIKILIDKNIVGNCIQYKDYESWFDTTYTAGSTPAKAERRVETPALTMVLGKA